MMKDLNITPNLNNMSKHNCKIGKQRISEEAISFAKKEFILEDDFWLDKTIRGIDFYSRMLEEWMTK